MEQDLFQGFYPQTVDFMWDLRFHNYKEWFQENKERYEQYLKKPMDLFAKELNKKIQSFDKTLEGITPAISRVNRDIRFSKNKAPYRDNKWVVFRQGAGRWQNKLVYYFEIGPETYSYGLGFYEAPPAFMQRFRERVDANEAEFARLVKKFNRQQCFVLEGERYKRKFSGEKSPEVLAWYQLKNFSLQTVRPVDQLLYERALLDKVEEDLKLLLPYYRYFSQFSSVEL